MKLIKKILLLLLLTAISYFGYFYIKNPIQIFPYPYIIDKNINIDHLNKSSDILIIGDDQAKSLTPYLSQISRNLSKNLRSNLIIHNISKENLGIHRLASILKQIKELPPVIILFTGSSEYNEKTFYLKYYNKIIKNFKQYKNEKLASMIMSFPFLSKFIYKNIKHIHLSQKIVPMRIFKKDIFNQKQMELKFILFEQKLKEIIEYLNDKNKKLIIVSPPINYEDYKVKSCSNSTNSMIENNIVFSLKNFRTLKLKKAYKKTSDLLKKYPGNASIYFLLAKISGQLGLKQKEKQYQKLSLVFDCSFLNINPVFKSIMKNLSYKYDLNYIDFNDLLNSKNSFIYKKTPQHIFLQKLGTRLELIIKKLISL